VFDQLLSTYCTIFTKASSQAELVKIAIKNVCHLLQITSRKEVLLEIVFQKCQDEKNRTILKAYLRCLSKGLKLFQRTKDLNSYFVEKLFYTGIGMQSQ